MRSESVMMMAQKKERMLDEVRKVHHRDVAEVSVAGENYGTGLKGAGGNPDVVRWNRRTVRHQVFHECIHRGSSPLMPTVGGTGAVGLAI